MRYIAYTLSVSLAHTPPKRKSYSALCPSFFFIRVSPRPNHVTSGYQDVSIKLGFDGAGEETTEKIKWVISGKLRGMKPRQGKGELSLANRGV